MFKLLSYKFLVGLDLPGKANLHNLPLSFFLGRVNAAFVMLGILKTRSALHSSSQMGVFKGEWEKIREEH